MNELIGPIIIAIVAAAPGIAALFAQRHKTKADVADTITGAAQRLVNEYQEERQNLLDRVDRLEMRDREQTQRIAEMQTEMMRLEQLVGEYRQGILRLMQQIEALGDNPVYRIHSD